MLELKIDQGCTVQLIIVGIFHILLRFLFQLVYVISTFITVKLKKKTPHEILNEEEFFDEFYADILEKGMATHSNILAWRIPWTAEPGGP